MKKNRTGVVFAHELKNYFKNKGFIVTLIIMFLAITILTSLPLFITQFKNTFENKTSDIDDFGIFIANKDIKVKDFEKYFKDVTLKEYDNVKKMRDDVKNDVILKALVINDFDEIKVIEKSKKVTDFSDSAIKDYAEYYKAIKLSNLNVDPKEVYDIVNLNELKVDYEVIQPKSASSIAVGYILLFVVYFLILNFGSMIAMNVAREKNDRSMEILITSTDSTSLINGKVFAGAVASASVLVVMVVALAFSVFLNKIFMPKDAYQDLMAVNNYVQSMGVSKMSINMNLAGISLAIDLQMILVFVLFAWTTYFMYLYVFATIGAFSSRLEDVNSFMTPAVLLIVASFLISMKGLYTPDGALVKAASFIPFSSGMAMFIRVGLSSVPLAEIIISYAILLLTTILICIASIKLYRRGTLMYGNKGLKSVFKAIKTKN